MTTFLFWNVNKQPLAQLVADIAHEHRVDVIALAESGEIPPAALLELLNATDVEYFYVLPEGCDKVALYTRFSPNFIPKQHTDERLTIRKLELPGLTPILFASMHLVSKQNNEGSEQLLLAQRYVDAIKKAEGASGHTRTVIVGDLNMSPFEEGVMSSGGFHAVMTRSIAEQIKRTVNKEEHLFFYNPMWSLMGDASAGPPGTYYYRKSGPNSLFWYMFDQVLLRPQLLSVFRNEQLKVLEKSGQTDLLSRNGLPQPSDHLPLLFSLQI